MQQWESLTPQSEAGLHLGVFNKGMRSELENKLDDRPHHKGFYKWIIDWVNGNPNMFILMTSFLATILLVYIISLLFTRKINFV